VLRVATTEIRFWGFCYIRDFLLLRIYCFAIIVENYCYNVSSELCFAMIAFFLSSKISRDVSGKIVFSTIG
jgi:hypothetical protein